MFNSPQDLLDKLNITKALYGKFDQDAGKMLSQQLQEEAFAEVYSRGDKVMTGFILLHFALALVFAFFHQTWSLAFGVGMFSVSAFGASAYFLPKSFSTRVLAGVILQVFVLLYIYQLQGLPEIRFFFFTSFVILIVYQDWRALLPGLLLFFGQMFVFAYLGSAVENLHIINHEYQAFILRLVPRAKNGIDVDALGLWFYMGISCLQVALTGLWAYFLRLNTINEILSKQNLLTKQLEIEKMNANLEVTVQQKTKDLQESLEMAQASAEELRQNMEELQATQEEIDKQRKKLLENRETMLQVEKELRERQSLMERSQWLESNLSRFDDLMRQYYDNSLENFSEAIMLELATLLKATQGAFYVFDESEQILRMTGGYACTIKTVKKAEFKVGEGVLGQIIKTKKYVLIPDLPVDTNLVESGLTKVRSKSLVIMPMLYNEDIQGVVEIAVLDDISDTHLEFLQRLAKNIATMLQSIRGISRTQKLLEQSQEMTAQLQHNTRELEATKLEVELKAMEFQSQFNAIDRSMIVLEYTTDGEILYANENFSQLSQYELEELMGKHHSIFLTEKYLNSEEYKILWHRIRNNDNVETEYECIAKDGTTFWMRTNYYALGKGKNKKIRVLAYDTTTEKEQDLKILEQLNVLRENEEMMQKNFELMQDLQDEVALKANEFQEQLNAINISTAMIEYNAEGIVRYVNDRFLSVTGFEKDELLGKAHQELVEKRFSESKSYKKIWERLNQREFVDGEFEFKAKDGSLIWLRGSFYPVADQKGKLLKVMLLATNITYEMQQEERIRDYLMDLEVTRSQLSDHIRSLESQLMAVDQVFGTVEVSLDGKIIKANQHFLEYAEYKKDDLVGKEFTSLFSKDFVASPEYTALWQRLQNHEMVIGEFVQITKQKKSQKLFGGYYPIISNNEEVEKIIGIFSKIPPYKNGVKAT
jgi:methyl-accepting chemotaxis protein